MSVTQINVCQSRYRFQAKSDGMKRGLCTQLILCVLAVKSNPYCILPFRTMILAGIYEESTDGKTMYVRGKISP